jgi:hypothetical protein
VACRTVHVRSRSIRFRSVGVQPQWGIADCVSLLSAMLHVACCICALHLRVECCTVLHVAPAVMRIVCGTLHAA